MILRDTLQCKIISIRLFFARILRFVSLYALCRLESNLPQLTTAIAALAGTSAIVLISGMFSGPRKILFQSFIFATSVAIAIAYLWQEEYALESFWTAYVSLPENIKLALAVVVIGSTYFGGAMYVAGITITASPERQNDTPASCDSCVSIIVPSTVPADDKKLFESMFDK